MTMLALGIDLGGTDIKAALVDPAGRIERRLTQPTQAELGPDVVIDRMIELVDRLRGGQEHDDPIEVVGIGVGTPGPLSPTRGVVFQAANLPGWLNVELRERISDRTKLPVVVDNDANVAAYAEYRLSGDDTLQNLVLLTLGSGIGAGTILNGCILHGHFENASEWGHMIVEPDGRPCPCGQHGCLEQYASAAAIARTATERVEQGESSSLAQGAPPGKGTTPSRSRLGMRITSADVATAAQAGDSLAKEIWDRACRYLAIGCVNIQHALNPQRIVLGGGMSAAGEFLLDPVRKHARAIRWKLCDDAPTITPAQLGNNAGTIGAGLLAWDATQ